MGLEKNEMILHPEHIPISSIGKCTNKRPHA